MCHSSVRPIWLWVVCVSFVVLTPKPSCCDDKTKLTPAEVLEYLGDTRGFMASGAPLVKAGDRAFDAYESLLADSETDGSTIGCIYLVLTVVKGDRTRFRGFALGHLGHQYEYAHRGALHILAEVGKQEDCGPIVALMWSRDAGIAWEAATTLGAIGGRGEMIAIDMWVRRPPADATDSVKKHLRECRDRIQVRLK